MGGDVLAAVAGQEVAQASGGGGEDDVVDGAAERLAHLLDAGEGQGHPVDSAVRPDGAVEGGRARA